MILDWCNPGGLEVQDERLASLEEGEDESTRIKLHYVGALICS